jgi:hypothetical protein
LAVLSDFGVGTDSLDVENIERVELFDLGLNKGAVSIKILEISVEIIKIKLEKINLLLNVRLVGVKKLG